MQLIFDKDKTAIIKGVAILLMIFLHVFSGSSWYEVELPMNNNQFLLDVIGTFKICVGLFTFMVGYGYAFAKNKSLEYSWHHVKQLLVVYWIVLIGLALPFALRSFFGGGNELILNMIALSSSLSWVNWFIHFYIWAMIVMPFIGRLIDRKPICYGLFSISIIFLGEVVLHELMPSYKESPWLQALFNCLFQSPCMILGYIMSQLKLFQKINVPISKFTVLGAVVLLMIVLFLRYLISALAGFNFDFFYAPSFIFGLLIIFTRNNKSVLARLLIEFGDKSVYMWFFHGLFFTMSTRWFYQPFILVSDNLWIIAIWTIILSYICSAIIKKVVEY